MYKALYRSYRPQTFRDVVGQQHITQTFQNAIMQNKFTHAYLISGPRGTGKTTLAKIVAKAVNCLNIQNNAEPCNQCEVCRGVNDGSLSDIIEIDAASNNGVDEIRDLREKAKYAPTLAKYKVYIIDEVHMLSTGAFNALLKTLEEPPKHVIFILATTELHKIPVTIVSRCQRFEVKKMTEEQITNRLAHVLSCESIEFEPASLALIARLSDGGMRDALSLLDQVISYSNQIVKVEDVSTVAGIATAQQVVDFLQALNEQNDGSVLAVIAKLFHDGKDLSQFIEQVLLLLRDILIAKTQTGADDIVALAKQFELPFLYEAITTFNTCLHELKFTSFPRLALESTALQFMYPTEKNIAEPSGQLRMQSGTQKKLQGLQNQIAELERQIKELQAQQKQEAVVHLSQPLMKKTTMVSRIEDYPTIYAILAQATLERDAQSLVLAQQALQFIQKQATQPMFAFLLDSTPKAASTLGCVFSTKYEHVFEQLMQPHMKKAVETYFEQLLQKKIIFEIVLDEQWQQLREQFAEKWKNQEVTEHSLVELLKKIEPVQVEQNQSALDETLNLIEENIQEDNQDDIIAVATDLFGDIVEVI